MKNFALDRDQFIKGGDSYLGYLNHIGDLANLELLKPNIFLKKIKDREIKILDLACGPGNAGDFLVHELNRVKKIKEITFVDVNAERLKSIPNSLISEKIVENNILDFIKDTQEKYDIAILRYAIYYFSGTDQEIILRSVINILNPIGCFIIGSFGMDEREADFLTMLHSKAMNYKGIAYKGGYPSPQMLQKALKRFGFSDFELSEGSTTWDIKSFSKKFGLDQKESDDLKKWLIEEAKEINLLTKEDDGNLFFEIKTYVLKGIKH